MADDEMNRRGFAFGNAHPLSLANQDLQVAKRAAPDFPGRVAGMGRCKRASGADAPDSRPDRSEAPRRKTVPTGRAEAPRLRTPMAKAPEIPPRTCCFA